MYVPSFFFSNFFFVRSKNVEKKMMQGGYFPFCGDNFIGRIFIIEGTIAAGKTTFCTWFRKIYNKYFPLVEVKVFEEPVNVELLKKYVKDPKNYAKEFQFNIMNARQKLIDEACRWVGVSNSKRIALVDRGTIGDLVFFQIGVERYGAKHMELAKYLGQLFQYGQRRNHEKICTIYYRTDYKEAYSRYIERKHADFSEDAKYEMEYFKQLEILHNDSIAAGTQPYFLEVEATKKLQTDKDIEQHIKEISDKLFVLLFYRFY